MSEKTGAVKRYEWVRTGMRPTDDSASARNRDETFILSTDFDALVEQRDRMREALVLVRPLIQLQTARNPNNIPYGNGLHAIDLALASSGERGK